MLTWLRNLFLTCLLLPAFAVADDVALGEFSATATLLELVGAESASRFEGVLEPEDAIEWEIYVPESYDPEEPAGLVVYISPMDTGRIPGAWKDVMAASNLIWIGANRSGNEKRVARRVTYAMVAPAVIARDYQTRIADFMTSERPGYEVVPLAIYYRYLRRIVANLIGVVRTSSEPFPHVDYEQGGTVDTDD